MRARAWPCRRSPAVPCSDCTRRRVKRMNHEVTKGTKQCSTSHAASLRDCSEMEKKHGFVCHFAVIRGTKENRFVPFVTSWLNSSEPAGLAVAAGVAGAGVAVLQLVDHFAGAEEDVALLRHF